MTKRNEVQEALFLAKVGLTFSLISIVFTSAAAIIQIFY